jgi:hypothetical protein
VVTSVNKFSAFCRLNLKITEITIHKFKKIKNKKKSEKVYKKLDEILRLLVIFFFKSASFGWLKFKFRQIYTNRHQILFFRNSQNIEKQI